MTLPPHDRSTATNDDQPDQTLRRIQVWFGDEVICSHSAPAWQARRYVALIGGRFAGLRVTVDDQPSDIGPALPHELLWDRTIR